MGALVLALYAIVAVGVLLEVTMLVGSIRDGNRKLGPAYFSVCAVVIAASAALIVVGLS